MDGCSDRRDALENLDRLLENYDCCGQILVRAADSRPWLCLISMRRMRISSMATATVERGTPRRWLASSWIFLVTWRRVSLKNSSRR